MTTDKNFKRLVRERAARTGQTYAAARRHLLKRRGETMNSNPSNVEVEISSILETSHDGRDFVRITLTEVGADRSLPIIVGQAEGTAIAQAVTGASLPRPMTHDLLAAAVDSLGARLVRVDISQGPNDTFTAAATLSAADGSNRVLDCRPSDALALAARTQPTPPIGVDASLLAPPQR